jgi:hypothetical protein
MRPETYSTSQNTLPMQTEVEEELKPRSKGIYLLPNLLTTACMFSASTRSLPRSTSTSQRQARPSSWR